VNIGAVKHSRNAPATQTTIPVTCEPEASAALPRGVIWQPPMLPHLQAKITPTRRSSNSPKLRKPDRRKIMVQQFAGMGAV
jgi:hypothetical protein